MKTKYKPEVQTWKEFEARINKIKPKTKADRHVLIAFKAYLKMYHDPNDQTGWKTPTDLIGNLRDECHDGAFSTDETDTPFLEYELKDFIKKYLPNIKPR